MPQAKTVVVVQMVGVPKCGIPIRVGGFDYRVISPLGRLGVYVEYWLDPDVTVAVPALEVPIELNHPIVPIGL